MQIGQLLKSFIYLVSGVLFYPILLLLSFLVLWTLFYAGGLVAEWAERKRLRKVSPEQFPEALNGDAVSGALSHRVMQYLSDLRALLAGAQMVSEPVIETLLQERTSAFAKTLDTVRMLVRVAPGLGLIGTLIPMGTGLAALGQGDITKLSSDLVIAFTTTVVGLAVGIVSYFFYTVKRRWIEHDIRMIEFITEVLAGEPTGDPSGEIPEEEESPERQ